MISFKKLKIESKESYEKLYDIVEPGLIDAEVIKRLQRYLDSKCDEIQVEYPYYDDDYLSTYYIHYSQKLRAYDKMCCRLHILKEGEYYGYVTLRPIAKGTKIGKTFLKPELLVKEPAYLILHTFRAHIVGNEYKIRSFPWKSQETDISVCAHTAAWSVIRYFGNRFRNYSDATIGELVQHIKNDWGRKTPSLGLTPVQVSDLFKDYGFSPLILERGDNFLNELIAYIESGIPVVGFLYPIKHAISIIGHGEIDYQMLNDNHMVEQQNDMGINAISHSALIRDLYVMDDNGFPYCKVPIGLPSKENDVTYGAGELKYVVVPLYRRMQLSYNEVFEKFCVWRKEGVMNWEELCIYRIYITSSNSLKEKALASENMNDDLRDTILNMTLPRFVWCIDIAGIENFKRGLTSGRIIIDTTASTVEDNVWLLRHDGEKIEFMDVEDGDSEISGMYSVIETKITPYNIYTNNLKEVSPLF